MEHCYEGLINGKRVLTMYATSEELARVKINVYLKSMARTSGVVAVLFDQWLKGSIEIIRKD
jgi:hypothetical protein